MNLRHLDVLPGKLLEKTKGKEYRNAKHQSFFMVGKMLNICFFAYDISSVCFFRPTDLYNSDGKLS